jgi:hypothetical protein
MIPTDALQNRHPRFSTLALIFIDNDRHNCSISPKPCVLPLGLLFLTMPFLSIYPKLDKINQHPKNFISKQQ